MKTYHIKLIVIVAAIILSSALTACNGAKVLEGAERDALLAVAEPMTDNLLTAIAANDQAAFVTDMDEKMTTAFTGEQLSGLATLINGKAGSYISREVKSVAVAQGFNIITYELKYDKAPAVSMRLILTTSEPYQITGLWFDAPELR